MVFLYGSGRLCGGGGSDGGGRDDLGVGLGDGKLGGLAGLLSGGWLDDDVGGFGEFALDVILGFVELVHGLTEAAGEFRELFWAEKHEDERQDDEGIRPCEVQDGGEDLHYRGLNTTD